MGLKENMHIYIGDCIKVMKEEKIGHPQLIITDPPYNISWNYGHEFKDNRKDYHSWCEKWADMCMDMLPSTGVFAIINYPENNNLLYTYMVNKGYNFIQQIIWHYHTNIGQSQKKYTRSYRTILIFSKTKDYVFHAQKGKYKNPTDKRISARIKQGLAPTLYDVWNINLTKNVSKTKKRNGVNQLPVELVKRLILSYSHKGDVVFDPFVGNGTVIDVALTNSRYAIGIDINDYSDYPDYCKTVVKSGENGKNN